ncbi:MAG TPA: hypothetical protein PK025_05680, partial [Spirochaetales bacterium]|nr:hypothetical protein [Spirochaetales bacterium]
MKLKATLSNISAFAEKTRTHVDRILHPKRMWVVLAGIALLVSLTIALLQPYRRSIVLWFPENKTGKLISEVRFVPWQSGKVNAVSTVVEELLLGPANPQCKPFTDQYARVKAVLASKDRFLIILDSNALFASSVKTETTNYPTFFKTLAHTVWFNTGVKHIS